jgi:hypothetical protein
VVQQIYLFFSNIILNQSFIKKKKINVIIYELDNVEEIILLNKLKKTKVIFYLHSSNFFGYMKILVNLNLYIKHIHILNI